jgi:hypothetical protein
MKWQEVQDIYMPAIIQLRNISSAASSSMDQITQPECIPLYLPSDIPASARSSLAGNLVDKETRMRVAQADDALTDLKRMLRITMGLWDYKKTNIGASQAMSTRTRSMIDGYRTKVTRCVDRYRAARKALLVLHPNGDWILRLRELKSEDVRPPERSEEEKRKEGKREVSWIWMTKSPSIPDGVVTEDEVNDSKCLFISVQFSSSKSKVASTGLRVEWAKAIARADRWEEDVILILEEMRRVLVFLSIWKATWWLDRSLARSDMNNELREGLSAYAAKQADIQMRLAASFADEWYPELARSGLSPDGWPAHLLESRSIPTPALLNSPTTADNSDAELDFDDDI